MADHDTHDHTGVPGVGGSSGEIAYAQITTALTVTATSEGAAQTVVALGSTTYANVAHIIEVYSPRSDQNGGTLICDLYVDSTILGRIMVTSAAILPVYAAVRHTPTAGAHTYTWKAWRATANPVIDADVGGTGKSVAAWIRSSVA